MLCRTSDRSPGKRFPSMEVLRLLKCPTGNGQVPFGMPLMTVVCPVRDKVFKRYHRHIRVETYLCLDSHIKSNKLYRPISVSQAHTLSISNHRNPRVLLLKSSQKPLTRIDSSNISLCRCAQFLLASKTIQTHRQCDRRGNRATIRKCTIICKLLSSKACSK